MPEGDVTEGYVIEHPNREKAGSKVTKAVVVALILGSVVLMLVVTIGGWDYLVGAKPLQIAYIALYVVLAFFIARWNRGALPLTAALAIILLIFAVVSVPAWYDRDKTGFAQPTIDSDVLGLVTLVLAIVQAVLIVAALRGFSQAWNVEVERPADGRRHRGDVAAQPA